MPGPIANTVTAVITPNFADKTVWTGENLDILRGINSDCVDLIYLDPPFNSNRNYATSVGSSAVGVAFKETYTLSDANFVGWRISPLCQYFGNRL